MSGIAARLAGAIAGFSACSLLYYNRLVIPLEAAHSQQLEKIVAIEKRISSSWRKIHEEASTVLQSSFPSRSALPASADPVEGVLVAADDSIKKKEKSEKEKGKNKKEGKPKN